jgi:hypothetical protein
MITEEGQNRPKTIYPCSEEDIKKLLSYDLFGIEPYTLGPRMYTELWGTIRIDEMSMNHLCGTQTLMIIFMRIPSDN